MWTFGNNIGRGDTNPSTTPVQVLTVSNVVRIGIALKVGMAGRATGTVWLWGNNGSGRLGVFGGNVLTPVSHPTLSF